MGILRGIGESLAGSALVTGGLSLGLLNLVSVHSVQEILPALTVLNVLNTDTDPLGENVSTHALVDNNSDSTLGNVEDTTGLTVVSLMGEIRAWLFTT